MSAAPVSLFAYGTLQLPDVLQAVVGQRWRGEPALLVGYGRYRLRGKPYPAIIAEPAGNVAGLLYGGLGPGELALLDSYRTSLTGLDQDELRALFMIFSVPGPLEKLGVNRQLKSALLKLSAALCNEHRADEEKIRQR